VLLLVLILILIAFGLLVVALLTGSVLWAWVSVAVSAVAALVLVVDTVQRRSAVRAGAQADAVTQDRPPRQRSYPELDPRGLEPVTEILPVVPSGGARSGRPERPASDAPAPEAPPAVPPAPPERAPAVDQSAGQRTQVMGPVQPSGSDTRPPGAAGVSAPKASSASPSVSNTGVDVAAAAAASPSASKVGSTPGQPTPPGPAGATVEAPRSGIPDHPATDAPPSTAAGGSGTADPGSAGDATVVVRAPGGGKPGADRKTGAEQSSGAGQPVDISKGASRTPPADGSGSAAGDGPTGRPVAEVPAGAPPVARQGGPAEPTLPGAPPPGAPAAQQSGPAEASGPVADADPPEEDRDPAVSAVVALLPDEVLVIDEQPRYHVTGCRALATRSTIPLPAREAVELGFTPCGWCNPDRTLAERHPARAQ
jgi:hypothetical protein